MKQISVDTTIGIGTKRYKWDSCIDV